MLHDLTVFGQICGLMKSLRRTYQGYVSNITIVMMIALKGGTLELLCSLLTASQTQTCLPICISLYLYGIQPAVWMYAHVSQNSGREFPERMEIATWTNVSSLLAKSIVERWFTFWSWTFACGVRISLSQFWSWTVWPVLIGQKSFFCIWSFTEVSHLHIWRVWIWCSWWHETEEEEEECKKPRKLTLTRQQPFTKESVSVDISESSTHDAVLWVKVFCGLWSRTT